MSENSTYDAGGQSLLYILSDDGQHTVYNESQVRVMLAQRVLTPETYFWREGMAEWRPLSDLHSASDAQSFVPPKRTLGSSPVAATPMRSFQFLSEQRVSQAPASDSPSQVAEPAIAASPVLRRRPVRLYEFDTNPVPLTIITLTLMVISMGVTIFFIFDCLGNILDGAVLSHADALGFSHFFIILVLGHVALEIMFFFWVYYANENSRGFAHNMTYTSGWAVGYFFVPILNLFRPYQVMQEIWKVSESPQSWYGTRNSIFVGFWFVIRLLTYFLSRFPYHTSYSYSDDPAVREIGTLVRLTTTETGVILIEITTFILISVVTWRQVQLVRRSDQIAIEHGDS